MKYAFLDSAGYVVQIVESEIQQPDSEIVDFDIGESPSDWHRFNWASKTWVDTRTEQQKSDIAANEVKTKRDSLLFQSDWTQIPNCPLSANQQEAWATYRQALRDITSQSGYPFNVVWPVKPE